jgi:hypothetical protein
MKKLTACLFLAAFLFSPLTVGAFALDLSCRAGEVVNETTATTTFITRYALNLRSGPSTDTPRIVIAPQGSLVQVTDFRDGVWFRVTFNGRGGYMYAEYLDPVYIPEIIPFTPPDLDNLAPVELIDWHTANALIVSRGASVTVIDVRTGIYWQMARLGGDLHADMETVTAEDTVNMHRAFNHTWTWNPRAVWVIVNGRTLAASINGMPHGAVTNPNNNVNGHFCLHFLGSWAHGATTPDPRHQNAVIEAFIAASD